MNDKEFYKNGVRYRVFPSRVRKMCRIEECPCVSSGEYCKKHTKVELKQGEYRCKRCFIIFDSNGFTTCGKCTEYNRLSSLIRHDKRRKFLLDLKIKGGGKCVDCNINDLEVLEFDHISGNKTGCVRHMTSFKSMETEANKCVLRCCNCHYIKTSRTVIKTEEYGVNPKIDFNRKYRVAARELRDSYKIKSRGCKECGWFDEDNLGSLHFDHIDEIDKSHNISRLVSIGTGPDIIKKEIEKCIILCGNCHRKRTNRQFNYPILDIIKKL